MINGAHVIIYSRDAEADRQFFRDVLDFAPVDAGDGWLVFKVPPAEVAVHPTDDGGVHELYLLCDDVEVTVAALTTKGAEFAGPPEPGPQCPPTSRGVRHALNRRLLAGRRRGPRHSR